MNAARSKVNENLKSPMYGAFTDINIWDDMLSNDEIDDWIDCKNKKGGNIINWQNISQSIRLTGLHFVNDSIGNICPKKFVHLLVTNEYRNFYETVDFCNKFGKMAEISSGKAAHAIDMVMESYHYSRLFTGYTDLDVKGNWVLHGTDKKLKWDNWEPGEPNNWGGDEHCVVMYTTLTLNDDSCSKKRIAQVCDVNEVSLHSASFNCNERGIEY